MLLLAIGASLATPNAPPEHFQTCRNLQQPARTCERLKFQGALNCTAKEVRRTCARSCDACTRLMAPVQVGMLMDGALPIPANATPILLEIGSSDRNTMDVEILPRLPDAFLVTAEPLIEKYSRALGRRRESGKVRDCQSQLGRGQGSDLE